MQGLLVRSHYITSEGCMPCCTATPDKRVNCTARHEEGMLARCSQLTLPPLYERLCSTAPPLLPPLLLPPLTLCALA